jgi:hypothetical protein
MSLNNSDQNSKDVAKESPSQRTIRLAKASIEALKVKGLKISKRSIADQSREIDVNGDGVSPSAIDRNVAANMLYQDARSWSHKSNTDRRVYWQTEVNHIKLVNDMFAKRRRLNRYRKPELINIIIELQRQHVELEAAIVSYANRLYDEL